MMTIAYYSMTGNIRRFLNAVDMDIPLFEVTEQTKTAELDRPFVFVTPTYGFGEVPDIVAQFIEHNKDNIVGVASSGNRNWGQNFAKSGEHLSEQFGVPLILKFELHGNDKERALFRKTIERVGSIYENFGREKIQSH